MMTPAPVSRAGFFTSTGPVGANALKVLVSTDMYGIAIIAGARVSGELSALERMVAWLIVDRTPTECWDCPPPNLGMAG